ncbi:MAG: hypothetical protein PHZ19_03985 [Candidatus Thermoplasmatota archaeon]|nr:hypothetical protein [Candidatus Thermoplasmatota archaeon]
MTSPFQGLSHYPAGVSDKDFDIPDAPDTTLPTVDNLHAALNEALRAHRKRHYAWARRRLRDALDMADYDSSLHDALCDWIESDPEQTITLLRILEPGPPRNLDAADILARKLACVDALADRLKLPPILRLTMQARMRAGHEAHAGQDLFARDLREEGRGEAVDLLNYTACQEDATPDDLQAAHLAASAWALLGGDAEGAEATPEPAQDRTCHTCAHLHTIRIGCRHPDGTGEQYEQTAHDGADCPLHEAAP